MTRNNTYAELVRTLQDTKIQSARLLQHELSYQRAQLAFGYIERLKSYGDNQQSFMQSEDVAMTISKIVNEGSLLIDKARCVRKSANPRRKPIFTFHIYEIPA